MNATIPSVSARADTQLLLQVRSYLIRRQRGLSPGADLEAAWRTFYDLYDRKIRVYAFTCGAVAEEVADGIQEVWRELLVRLPAFQLDVCRGQFDTWLFAIVKSKMADLCRSRKRRLTQGSSDGLQTASDHRPSPGQTLEEKETAALVWDQLKKRLSPCNFQVLQMRLVEQRPVVEVAAKLGLSHEQVWYRYHRARRELEEIGSTLACGSSSRSPFSGSLPEKVAKEQEFAQGKAAGGVSRTVGCSSLAPQGDNCVDYVFQKLELGRRELTPEWKVEWNCDGVPKPVLYIRKMALVAYAEICGCGDFINTHWPRIANAAIAAGVAAGIATIIATPTAALPIFQAEFYKQFQGKVSGAWEEKIHVALSAKQEPTGPWCLCKD